MDVAIHGFLRPTRPAQVVAQVGVEPTWYCYHTILSRARLPVPPLRHKLQRGKSASEPRIEPALVRGSATRPLQGLIIPDRINRIKLMSC